MTKYYSHTLMISQALDLNLDNFIIFENLSSDICRYYSINEGDNLWYHIPIVVDITLSTEYFNDIQKRKATPGQFLSYRDLLSNLLNGIEIPIQAMYCKKYVL